MQDLENDIEQCLAVLKNGGLILYPTDTIWGIGCDATNEDAVAKVYGLKQRIAEKSMIIFLADIYQLAGYIAGITPEMMAYAEQAKKPTTIIFDNAINLAKNLINADGSVAVRIPKNDFCKQLIERFEKPIVSTSANISGHDTPANFSQISDTIKNGVEYIVQHRRDEVQTSSPSAIIKWNNNGSLTIIRP